MSIASEFKAFISRGNVIDMAVGVIIGASFGKIVESFVKDLVTPPLGFLIGRVDFTDLKISLGIGSTPVTVNYGVFLQACFNFLIIAAAVFLLVKLVARLTRKQAAALAAAPPPADVVLLTEIRDELRKRP
ncbi:MAG: large-conductance mechanosensitive channel protein MscL [Fibrobacterota bacterium]|nr:large-conductance mechanosensitive channel protein MscL [Fibrobacterota bacterium]QQS04197.1 MAG: large-conductance mechanosensitive channel protein MscL [Fibrobacterota bacterium]